MGILESNRIFKWGLVDHPRRNIEDIGAGGDLNFWGLGQEVSEEKNVNMWPRDCFCDVLVKNMAAFCPCPKNLPEAKVKRFRITALAKEISKQSSINFVVWLLKFTLTKCIFMKRSKPRKEKYKMYGSSIKGAPGSGMKLNPPFKEINRLRGW